MLKTTITAGSLLLVWPAIIAAAALAHPTPTPPTRVAGIDPTLLHAYQRAAVTLHDTHPHCSGMRWSILAGIGKIESNHAVRANIAPNGDTTPPIIGPRLDGSGVGGNLTPHYDTDNGRWDNDTAYDRAVGVTQHLPANWDRYGIDANNDGEADPHNVYDAAAATAVELCASAGGDAVDFTDRDQLADALYRYNPAHWYVEDVLAQIDHYDTLPVTPTSSSAGSGAGHTAVEWALQQLGKPYLWGGTGPDAFDCSGLTQAAWAAAGVQIPRVTTDQFNHGTRVSMDQLQPGDLLFYDTTDVGAPGPAPSHVTLYAGNGQMINAPSSGQVVRIEPIESAFYSPRFMGAIRPA